MADETTTLPPEDEINLLDLLLVVAENARLLIFGPLLAGLAALGIAFIIPPTIRSFSRRKRTRKKPNLPSGRRARARA